MNISTKAIVVALFCGLMGSGLLSCKEQKKDKKEEVSKAPVKVTLSSVVKEDIAIKGRYTSLLEPKATNNIMAQSGGRLTTLYVGVGDRIVKGQLIARLDETQLKQSRIRLDEAERNFRRLDDLYKLGAIARVQWEQAKSNYDIAKELNKNLSDNTLLKSPTSGLVTQRFYDEGDLTSPQKPVVIVEDLSQVKAIINVSEQYFSYLKQGLKATLELDALPNEVFKASINKVYPTIDPRTHTIKVELLVPNKGNKLRTGMFARLTLDFGDSPKLLVSDKAVHKVIGSGSRYVYVFNGGRASYREVSLGKLYGSRYEVLGGLAQGEKVIVSAINNISDGEEVVTQ